MPWWIWPLIVVFMLCMIAIGSAFVVFNAIKLAKVAFGFSESVFSRFEKLNNSNEQNDQNPKEPLFTLPIKFAAERYERTRENVVKRHTKIRDAHRLIWQHWDEKSLREEDIKL